MCHFCVKSGSNNISDTYDVHSKVLGQGRFAVVKAATCKKTGQQVAVKVIDKSRCKIEDQAKLHREIDILKKIRHPNCIQLLEVFETAKYIEIVTEKVTGGELFDRIVVKDHFNETEAAKVFVQIIKAIDYLHSIGVVHRDLKPENVLFASPAEDSPVKIADFGLGKIVPHDDHAMKTVCGTPIYVAPEVLMKKGYGMECDIWSAGVMLYILLCGCPPFDQDMSLSLIFDAIKHARYDFPAPYWDDVSEEAKKLVSGMLTADPKSRLTCSECLQHAWVQKFYQGGLSTAKNPGFKDQLKGFNIARKLKGALLTFSALSRFQNSLSYKPTPKEAMERLADVQADSTRLAELRESFDLLDRNHLDQITVEDVAEFLHKFGNYTSHAEAKKMVDGIDLYHLGHISFDEFCIMMGPVSIKKASPVPSEDLDLDLTFSLLDARHSGVLSKEDIQEVLKRVGSDASEGELDLLMRWASKDALNKGTLDKRAFFALMQRPSDEWDNGEAPEGWVSDVY
ncbi:kinase-like domain-containing protein [Baffinella frigidus]|nr:kinase-like domain-containing protein [Cryptophyta sp. CCMP2293]